MNQFVYLLLVTILSLCRFTSIYSQTFQDVTTAAGIDHSYQNVFLGAGASFFDFDNDGWDDITLSSSTGESMFYKNISGSFIPVDYISINSELRQIVWVDYDNDGDNDISLAEVEGIIRLFENNGQMQFTEIPISLNTNLHARNFGLSWGDYDRDGLLDLYTNRYPLLGSITDDYYNTLWKNLGDGTFQDVTISSNIYTELIPAFDATWFDYNNDGWLDLHVISDKFIESKKLFSNNQDGTFTDISVETQTDIQIDAMSSSIADYDNDNDFDIYCTNGEMGNFLMRLTDGVYENLFPNAQVETYAACWGANWIDYNNDTWKDLFVCVDSGNNLNNELFTNQSGTFSSIPNTIPSNGKTSFSPAKGDLNNDGLYDLVILNTEPYTSTVLENQNTDQNGWIKLHLEGVVSNKQAVGSRIEYYLDGQRLTEFTHCGSDYLSQDAQKKIIGTADHQFVDSLMIRWPNGLEEFYYDLPVNSEYHFIEGYAHTPILTLSGIDHICPEETIELSLQENVESLVWSDGSNFDNLSITEPGIYWATVETIPGVFINSDTLHVLANTIPIIDSIEVAHVSCYGFEDGAAIIHIDSGNNTFDTAEFDSLGAGNYTELYESGDSCPILIDWVIEEPIELVTVYNTTEPSCYGELDGSVDFTSFGGTPGYSVEITPNYNFDALLAGNYTFTTTDANGCSFTDSFLLSEPDIFYVQESYHTDVIGEELGTAGFSYDGGTPPYQFYLNDELVMDNLFSDLTVGSYCFEVIDDNNCAQTDCVFIDMIESTGDIIKVDLNVFPNPSNRQLTFSSDLLGNKEVVISNAYGEVVLKQDISSEVGTIDILDLSQGYYSGIIISERGNHRFSFIKN